MAYAGIQSMLLAYKLRKSDKEFELMQITSKRVEESKKSSEINEALSEATNQVSQDDPNYVVITEEINNEYNVQLASIAAMEEELDRKQKACETEISYLDGYIQSWQQALQAGVAKDHSYGAK